MSVTIKDNRAEYDKLVGELYNRNGFRLEVGVLKEDADTQYADGVTILQAAIWNEFGTPTIPSRSWLRGWFDENQDLVLFWFRGEMRLVVDGQQTKRQALARVGEKCAASIKERIINRIPPPNAPSTIAKKGSDVPLIDTGLLITTIRSAVRQ